MVRIGIYVGGTFTDFALADTRTGVLSYFKVSSSPADPSLAIAQGTQEMLARFGVAPADVAYFGHGTTVATNMVIERRGVTTGLVTTRGFRDVLAIGRQTRPSLYDYGVRKPAPLVRRYQRLEVDERVEASGAVLRPLDESALAEVCAHWSPAVWSPSPWPFCMSTATRPTSSRCGRSSRGSRRACM